MSQFHNKDKDSHQQKSSSSNNLTSTNLKNASEGSHINSTENNNQDEQGATGFFSRLKKDLARPVPGILRIIRQSSDPESTSSNNSSSPTTTANTTNPTATTNSNPT